MNNLLSKRYSFTTILACTVIITTVLLSGVSGGNTLNFVATVVFVGATALLVLIQSREVRIPPEVAIVVAWICCAMLSNFFAVDSDLAIQRTILVLQLTLLLLLLVNAQLWSGSIAVFVGLYVIAAILSYLVGFAGFGTIEFGPGGELAGESRATGTAGNANRFGRAMVQGQVFALLAISLSARKEIKIALILSVLVLGLAVINSGSRTALAGMIAAILGSAWAFDAWRLSRFSKGVALMVPVLLVSTGIVYVAKDVPVVKQRLEAFQADTGLLQRYMNMYRLVNPDDAFSRAAVAEEGSLSVRQELAETAWREAMERIPFGLGLNNFSAVHGTYAHSNYMEIVSTTGVLGLVAWVSMYFSLALRARKYEVADPERRVCNRMVLVGVVVAGVMDIGNVGYHWKPYWIYIALLVGVVELSRQRVSQRAMAGSSQAFSGMSVEAGRTQAE